MKNCDFAEVFYISRGVEDEVARAHEEHRLPWMPLVNLPWTNYPQLDIPFNF